MSTTRKINTGFCWKFSASDGILFRRKRRFPESWGGVTDGRENMNLYILYICGSVRRHRRAARLGFEQAGGTCVFACETDGDARRTYEENFGETPAGDIREIPPEELPDFDILLADFPYPISQVWGERGLFDAVEEILREKRPEAFFMENGKNLLTHSGGRTYGEMKRRLTELGYTVYGKVLNAGDFGVPQKRERLVTVGFSEPLLFAFPEKVPAESQKSLADILEPESQVKRSYYVSAAIRDRKMKKMLERCDAEPERPYITNENVSGMVTPHRYACSLRAGASANYLLVNNERRLTEREMFRLQGFPDSYRMPELRGGGEEPDGEQLRRPAWSAGWRSGCSPLSSCTRGRRWAWSGTGQRKFWTAS